VGVLRYLVIGLGNIGTRRARLLGTRCAATVDPIAPGATVREVAEVDPGAYDAVILATPNPTKIDYVGRFLAEGKPVLVEKPLLFSSRAQAEALAARARGGAVWYTSYNHRFEPHIVNLKRSLESGQLGRVYSASFFYGNGTARDVRNSPWRDQGFGVLTDLGSHLLDTILFLFGPLDGACRGWRADRFENQAYDRFFFGFHGPLPIDCEMTLLSWRNTFHADVYGELGSAHIDSLCKWGPSTFTIRRRIFPSGRPNEESSRMVCADPTWAMEYEHFKALCQAPRTNIQNDIWIQSKLQELMAEFT